MAEGRTGAFGLDLLQPSEKRCDGSAGGVGAARLCGRVPDAEDVLADDSFIKEDVDEQSHHICKDTTDVTSDTQPKEKERVLLTNELA